jgi:N-acetylneuraminic acid mutarotase
VFGGWAGDALSAVEEYDPVSNTWSSRTPMPTPRWDLACVTVGNKIYAIGGRNVGVLDTVEIYDPQSNTWLVGISIPTPRTGLGCALVNGKIYAIGGRDLTMASDANEVYDTLSRTWHRAAPLPTPRGYYACVAMDSFIYAIGGLGTDHLTVNEVYNVNTDIWQTRAAMPTARKGPGSALYGGRIYVIGGSNTGYVNVNEEYDPVFVAVGEQKTAKSSGPEISGQMTTFKINITCAVGNGQLTNISLFDINGCKVDEWQRPLTRNLTLHPNSGLGFPKGIYFLVVYNEDLNIVKKLVCYP